MLVDSAEEIESEEFGQILNGCMGIFLELGGKITTMSGVLRGGVLVFGGFPFLLRRPN
jgi:hypothetical protein